MIKKIFEINLQATRIFAMALSFKKKQLPQIFP